MATKIPYGIQLYSVRDITEKNLEGAIRQVAELGYQFVEFAGFFGRDAETVRDCLRENHLTVSGTHTGGGEVFDHFDETVQYHHTIGNRNLIIPGADLSSQEKIDAFIEKVNQYQPLLEKEGIRLGYHNHSHEFLPNADGSLIYDQLLARTKLYLEIDTYWAYVAGKDPVQLMEQLQDRLIFIHIKDGDSKGEGTPLGLGQAPIAAVYEQALALNVPMVVESETLTPDGMTEAKLCIEELVRLENARR